MYVTPSIKGFVRRWPQFADSFIRGTSLPPVEGGVPLRVRQGPQKKPPGFQVHIVCLTPFVNGELPGSITALSINSSYGLMTYGNESGLVIVDIIQKTCLMNCATPDLYGAADPYQRVPRSPKKGAEGCGNNKELEERCRSPSTDQEMYPHLRRSRVGNHLVKTTLRTPERDYNLNLLVINSPVYCESDALDHVATKAILHKDSAKLLEAPIVLSSASPVASSPLKTTPLFDGDERDSLTPGVGFLSNASSQAVTPDEVEEGAEPKAELQQPHGRRRSSAWKGFSLKKQLSRVDQRLKHTFSADHKRGAVFYCASTDSTPPILSPVEGELPLETSLSCAPYVDPDPETLGDKPNIPLFETVHDKETSVTKDNKTLLVRDETLSEMGTGESLDVNDELAIIEETPILKVDSITDSSPEAIEEAELAEECLIVKEVEDKEESEAPKVEGRPEAPERPSRPMDLPLFDADGRPLRPPRRDGKKRSMVVVERVEKRDVRLLSVPNIKYTSHHHHEPQLCKGGGEQWVYDLRGKEDITPASFGGLMKRFRASFTVRLSTPQVQCYTKYKKTPTQTRPRRNGMSCGVEAPVVDKLCRGGRALPILPAGLSPQINGVCVSPTSGKQAATAGGATIGAVAAAASSPRSRPPDPVRRSKSQGTRKQLHKCLSTASYSDSYHSPSLESAGSNWSLGPGGGCGVGGGVGLFPRGAVGGGVGLFLRGAVDTRAGASNNLLSQLVALGNSNYYQLTPVNAQSNKSLSVLDWFAGAGDIGVRITFGCTEDVMHSSAQNGLVPTVAYREILAV
uniref:Uncharacterized protein n=1 Tax=Timema poppense TaxID=170557 RepID=A0A7R9CSI8_TIMPO|nr:unnamed protein product [Timema poppensis]